MARRSLSRLATAVRAPADVPRMPAFDHVPLPYDGPSAVEIARKRAEFLSPSLFHFYSNPVSVLLSRSLSRQQNSHYYLTKFSRNSLLKTIH
jgi:alanine-glyoxylate transaminase/(R)-3-amino-2-methylpropionate-pyruvate transaminase